MIQVTIFSGHEGRLRSDRFFYFTLFGGCDLVRPTIARQLMALRGREERDRADGRGQHAGMGPSPGFRVANMELVGRHGERGHRRGGPFFLTIFGGVDIKSPTLAEEFLDLREMISGGALTLEDWDRAMASLGSADIPIASFTLFGGFDECELPSESEEIDSLAIQRHLGNISESAGRVLQLGIGQRDARRSATVRRALQAVA